MISTNLEIGRDARYTIFSMIIIGQKHVEKKKYGIKQFLKEVVFQKPRSLYLLDDLICLE